VHKWSSNKCQICFSVFLAILSSWDLGAQQGFFKLTMKSNASQAIVEVAAFGN
jgi:hypothetical protein